MAAATRVKARVVTPPGYEFNRRGRMMEAVTAGDLLVQHTDFTWKKAPTGTKNAEGIALTDGYAGQTIDIGIHGEMDGWSGLAAGPLYPSASVAGGLDTTAPTYYAVATTPAVAVPAMPNVRAISATRIAYNFA